MASFSKKEKVKYLKELNLKDEDVSRFIKRRKKKKEDIEEVIEKGYTTYEINYLGKVANYFTRDIAYSFVKKNPKCPISNSENPALTPKKCLTHAQKVRKSSLTM